MTDVLAARLNRHGDPTEVITVEEVPLREPGAGEVVLDLLAGGLNPVDGSVARGLVAPEGPLPRTLGSEAVGTVEGRRYLVVDGRIGKDLDGVWAAAAVVPRSSLVAVPDGVDTTMAACAGIAGLTAWNCLVDRAKLTSDDRVLVLGAGGGVGLPLVSLAAGRGAQVVGQIGTASKEAAVRAAGATDVVVTDAAGLAAALDEWRPTVVVDPLSGPFLAAALGHLAPRGRYVVYGTSAGPEVTLNFQKDLYRSGISLLGYSGFVLTPDERTDGLTRVLAALADGTMAIPVGEVLPLRRVADGFRLLQERGVTGKVVLDLTAR